MFHDALQQGAPAETHIRNMANHVTKTNLHYKSMWVHTMLFHSKFMLLALLLGKKDVSRNMPEGESASTFFFETFFFFHPKG